MSCIEARGLRKVFGTTIALDGIDLRIEEGRILGLIGPNGAGKTTALNAILGLTPYQGELKVLGRDPWTERDELMRHICFIADVAVLPRWMRVSQALDYVDGVHPRFDRAKAEGFLAKTAIKRSSKVRELSKGMVTQLHLALVMAIDARLLVLDEPTIGLDILYRKQFYDSLLNDYFDHSRTIVVTTHQVEEVQDVLTDIMFIKRSIPRSWRPRARSSQSTSARFSAAASCYSIMSIVTNSPHLATSARPASQTCSLPLWAIRPARRKEPHHEYSIERRS